MKVCIINFSGRTNGNCQKISECILEELKPLHEVSFANMNSITLTPCGQCNYECFIKGNICPHYNDSLWSLYETISSSDLVYFVVPNYCDYPCANFFIFSERGQGFFTHTPSLLQRYTTMPKKFIVMSNTNTDNFTQVFRCQSEDMSEPDVLFLRAQDYKKRSLTGDLMDCPEAKSDLLRYVQQTLWAAP